MRGKSALAEFDRLSPRVREALRDTAFEMDPGDFLDMSEDDALRWINSIDRDVRAADNREKRGR